MILPVYDEAHLRALMRRRAVTLTVHMASDWLEVRITKRAALDAFREAERGGNDLSYYGEPNGFEDGTQPDGRAVPMMYTHYGKSDVRLTTF